MSKKLAICLLISICLVMFLGFILLLLWGSAGLVIIAVILIATTVGALIPVARHVEVRKK